MGGQQKGNSEAEERKILLIQLVVMKYFWALGTRMTTMLTDSVQNFLHGGDRFYSSVRYDHSLIGPLVKHLVSSHSLSCYVKERNI